MKKIAFQGAKISKNINRSVVNTSYMYLRSDNFSRNLNSVDWPAPRRFGSVAEKVSSWLRSHHLRRATLYCRFRRRIERKNATIQLHWIERFEKYHSINWSRAFHYEEKPFGLKSCEISDFHQSHHAWSMPERGSLSGRSPGPWPRAGTSRRGGDRLSDN